MEFHRVGKPEPLLVLGPIATKTISCHQKPLIAFNFIRFYGIHIKFDTMNWIKSHWTQVNPLNLLDKTRLYSFTFVHILFTVQMNLFNGIKCHRTTRWLKFSNQTQTTTSNVATGLKGARNGLDVSGVRVDWGSKEMGLTPRQRPSRVTVTTSWLSPSCAEGALSVFPSIMLRIWSRK